MILPYMILPYMILLTLSPALTETPLQDPRGSNLFVKHPNACAVCAGKGASLR
jgi:hypothetical protein